MKKSTLKNRLSEIEVRVSDLSSNVREPWVRRHPELVRVLKRELRKNLRPK